MAPDIATVFSHHEDTSPRKQDRNMASIRMPEVHSDLAKKKGQLKVVIILATLLLLVVLTSFIKTLYSIP